MTANTQALKIPSMLPPQTAFWFSFVISMIFNLLLKKILFFFFHILVTDFQLKWKAGAWVGEILRLKY